LRLPEQGLTASLFILVGAFENSPSSLDGQGWELNYVTSWSRNPTTPEYEMASLELN